MSVVPVDALDRCLRELTSYVVLRNETDLIDNLRRGGDVDLLVREPALAESALVRHLGVPVRITRHSYVTEYGYDWGSIDVLPSIEWRGARFLDSGAVLDGRRISERGRPVPRLAHEAAISWLTSVLWGGFFNERYAPAIRQAAETDGAAFQQVLVDATGRRWGLRLLKTANRPEASAGWTRPLRRAVRWRAGLKSPLLTTVRFVTFVVAELRLRYDPPVPWIAIFGHDGNRESSVVDAVVRRFESCPYAKARAVTIPHEKAPRRTSGSPIALLMAASGWLIRYWTRLVHLRAKGNILAFDGVPPELGVVFPKPDLVFLVVSQADALTPRRQGDRARDRQVPAVHELNGSLPEAALADEVQRVIRTWMLERSVAQLHRVHAPLTTATAAGAQGSSGAPT